MISPDADISQLNAMSKNNMGEHLGIIFTEVTSDSIAATMPVDNRTKQPFGLLHGGASVVLAETLGSVGSYLCVDQEKFRCVGLEINANHIKSVKEGLVHGKATIIHKGSRTHIWEIRIKDDQDQLVCVSRLTVAVIKIY